MPAERIALEYLSIRDRLVFTNLRVICIDIQGLTGKKAEFFVLPYSKSVAFSVETAGSLDLDAEPKLWASGLGKTELAFVSGTDVKKLAQCLGRATLDAPSLASVVAATHTDRAIS